jgi:V/A-type H+-transporting ATPase subunit D
METPLWIDDGVRALKEIITMNAKLRILEKQLDLVREELRVTAQRVNLFEKIKIPETAENIRKIQIFLGDMQTAAVITGKIAKQQIEVKAGA